MNTPNTGVLKATAAAQAINAKLVVPEFEDISTLPSDLNDLACLQGLPEVQRQVANAKEVAPVLRDEAEKQLTLAAKAIELTKNLELFRDKQNVLYATINNNECYQTWRLDSRDFQDWLKHEFWNKHNYAINGNALQDVLGILQGKARFDGECKEVFLRVATVDNATYIDLANEKWEVLKVTSSGYEILSRSRIKFTRLKNMQSLPIPIDDGNIERIWHYINIPQKYRKLVLAFMLECFRSNTPFPVLVLYGTAGSAKSTTQTILRMLTDPSACNLRTAPKKREDLLVAAANNWIVSFNNVSHLSNEQQDDLCCIATGGGLSTRELFTTYQESCVDIKRPVIINGIGDLVTAQDLIDRCIVLDLPEIPPKNRKTEEEIMRAFNQEYAAIFGALLDILSKTLQELTNIKLNEKPRMADFAILGCALEKVMSWEQGSFMEEYTNNRNESMSNALEHSPVAVALTRYIYDEVQYQGSIKRLYSVLTSKYKPDTVSWPKSEKGLAGQIRRQKQALRSIGIEIVFDEQRHNDGYHVSIYKLANNVHDVHDVHNPFADGS